MSEIVVGVDASEASRAALEWAVAEAPRRNATITAVAAWENSIHAGSMTRLPGHDAASDARAMVAAETRTFATADAPIATEVVEGKATKVLTERSATAELLVIGSSAGGRRVGSIALHCVQHARCTVVVVKPAPS